MQIGEELQRDSRWRELFVQLLNRIGPKERPETLTAIEYIVCGCPTKEVINKTTKQQKLFAYTLYRRSGRRNTL